MSRKSSSTARTPSNSRRKPAAKNTRVQKWPVYWVRAVNGDEFIARAKPSRDGWTLLEPTMITSFQNQMLLAPYGMMSKDRSIFLEKGNVLHANEVTDIMVDLYDASTASVDDVVESYFNKVIQSAIDLAKKPLNTPVKPSLSQLLTESTSEEQLKQIAELSEYMDETLGRPKEFEGVQKDRPRTRSETLDNLMKLAEKAGKGKKTS